MKLIKNILKLFKRKRIDQAERIRELSESIKANPIKFKDDFTAEYSRELSRKSRI